MSRKSPGIAALIAKVTAVDQARGGEFDPHYIGFFECFNRQMYYEAHDVLEELWLGTKGELHGFYKGLIQLAGAFVHLEKGRLNPAARLLRLSLGNLEAKGKVVEGLDVAELRARMRRWLTELEESDYTKNPYHPAKPPNLCLKPRQA